MKINKENSVFLLGGHDLEMLTIRDILSEQGLTFYDHDLQWSTAKLSSYALEIQQAEKAGKDIYGIELTVEIGETVPANYRVIDHHNENSSKTSSLKQVLELLGIESNRHYDLVSANDVGYIPGMENLGASKDEIKAIRDEDRHAQGITPEDESIAKESIKNNYKKYNYLITVKSDGDRFSIISDLLYPYDALLIYNDTEFTFYGRDTETVKGIIQPLLKDMYSGGQNDRLENTYMGAGHLDEKTIEMVKERIIDHFNCYSYHIFYFPFEWKFKDNGKKGKDTPKQLCSYSPLWEKVDSEDTKLLSKADRDCLFDEKQYFFEYAHNVLYDKSGSSSEDQWIVRHFERRIKTDDNKIIEPSEANATYHISIKNKQGGVGADTEYILKIDAINLNLYRTGVGILTFYLANKKESQKDELSVRNINQYGRRIMPPNHLELEKNNRITLAQSIEIRGLGTDLKEEFKEYNSQMVWETPTFIKKLLEGINIDIKKPMIDDRMLVNCWYANQKISYQISHDKKFLFSNDWYKHVFIDEGFFSTCPNREMRRELLQQATYLRWQDCGTLYGVSRYSLIAITDDSWFSCNVLTRHMRTLYARIFELVIVQLASILRFNDRVCTGDSDIEKNLKDRYEEIDSLYEDYIHFINKMYFEDVTAQDQGIELYHMLRTQFRLKDRIKHLDTEVSKLHEFSSMRIGQENNKESELLNLIAIVFVPASFVAAIFGMNPNPIWRRLCIAGCIIVIWSICFGFCAKPIWRFFKELRKSQKRKKGQRKRQK